MFVWLWVGLAVMLPKPEIGSGELPIMLRLSNGYPEEEALRDVVP